MLKVQYFSHLMQTADSLEKILMLGKSEGRRRRGWQRVSWLDGITDSRDRSLSKFWEMVKARETWRAALHGVAKSQTQLSEWKTIALEDSYSLQLECQSSLIMRLSTKFFKLFAETQGQEKEQIKAGTME